MPGLSVRTRTLAHISLTLVGLMWVLPFLYPAHAYPITTFHQEWWALLLGLGGGCLLLWPPVWQRLAPPAIILLPLGLLGIGLSQWQLGMLAYPAQAGLLAAYMLWAVLLILLGQRLRIAIGLPAVAMTLAACMVVGAELNAISGLFQHFGWRSAFSDHWITTRIAHQIYGNLAQPNHYANQLALGIASLGALFAGGVLSRRSTLVLLLPLLFTLTLSGSRSSVFYLSGFAALAWLWQKMDLKFRPLWHYSLSTILGFMVMHGLVKLPWINGAGQGPTTWSRLYQESGGNSIRLDLWQEAFHIWSDHPWLGAGFGQFGWQHFQMGPERHHVWIVGLYNNAHNLLLQLGAEFGLAGVLLLVLTLLAWGFRLRHDAITLWHWWALSLLAVIGIHSLLEYPLWYAYFLGIAALLLGLLDRPSHRPHAIPVAWFATAATVLLGLTLALSVRSEYGALETFLQSLSTHNNDPVTIREDHALLNKIAEQPLLRPYAELYLNPMYAPNQHNLSYKHALNHRVLHSTPIGQVAYREVIFLALADKSDEAKTILECALWSYPDAFAENYARLAQWAQNDPARFEGLLKFAQQKFWEYQGAVSAR